MATELGVNAAIVAIMYLWIKNQEQRVEHLKNEVNKWQKKYVELQERTLKEFENQTALMETLYERLKDKEN